MCRFAFTNYKPRYACFSCRKAFRRRHKREVDPAGEEHPARCPDCHAHMADMGLDFRPPSKSDRRAWQAAEALWEVGETFHSCGCSGPGFRPRDPRALDAFLRARLDEYRGNLRSIIAESSSGADAIATWRDRIRRLETSLATSRRAPSPRKGAVTRTTVTSSRTRTATTARKTGR